MQVRFAARCTWSTEETEWARALRERRERGAPILDLTASNPTRCGFHYDEAALLGALSDRAALDYDPDPRGMRSAREAVVGYYHSSAALGVAAELAAENILLTTSTSEAYSYLFRLLCNPGDEVLIAQPSYPLFEFLATIDDVRLVPYPLFYDYGWHVDTHALRQAITPRTRALVVVHPNNPTGHYTDAAARRELEAVCVEHGLALIVDEVFLDYPLETKESPHSFVAGEHPALTFVLSGLSKVAGLPQMKAAWLACAGPAEVLAKAMAKLEVIADSFLSMNAPVQGALPRWLAGRHGIQEQIRTRVRGNLQVLDALLAPAPAIARLRSEGGWYAVLRVPALGTDEARAVALLRECGVAVHPGSFFGFAEGGWLVVSLLTPAAEFAEGAKRLVAACADS